MAFLAKPKKKSQKDFKQIQKFCAKKFPKKFPKFQQLT
jgi:hypothetical protein